MSTEFKVGDVVRVKDPDQYISSFGKKIKDRDAIVLSVFTPAGSAIQRCRVEFQKRNGRGKEFIEIFRCHDLLKKEITP